MHILSPQAPSRVTIHSCSSLFYFNCSYAYPVSFSPSTKMRKNRNYSESFRVFQRVFNFFVNNLIARPHKRVALGHADAASRNSTEVSVDDPSSDGVNEQQVPLILETTKGEEKLHHQGQERSKDTGSGFEIQVQFKETEEASERWTHDDKLGFSTHEPTEGGRRTVDGDQLKMEKGDGFPISLSGKGQLPDDNLAIQKRKKVTEPPHDKEELPLVQFNGAANGMTIRGKTKQETEPSMSTMAREKGPKKPVNIQDSKEEDRAKKRKDIISENLTPAREEPKNVLPVHFISVAANINEKSDAFIRRKKEEMRRNL